MKTSAVMGILHYCLSFEAPEHEDLVWYQLVDKRVPLPVEHIRPRLMKLQDSVRAASSGGKIKAMNFSEKKKKFNGQF